MSIFLIRHGETAGNAERVVQMPETPLSARGMAQAERLARRLSREGVEQILCSNYVRAAMTAAPLRETTGAPVAIHPELRERHYGELRGRPYAEVGQYILMEGYEPPGGESWEVFHSRVDRGWARVQAAAARVRGNLAVVTHGLVCYSLASRRLQLPDGADAPTRFGNTALTVVEHEPPWIIRLLGCCAHLEGESEDDAASPSGI